MHKYKSSSGGKYEHVTLNEHPHCCTQMDAKFPNFSWIDANQISVP
jgi:hypothetical protein